jgi:asparagine synthase (glutamine-hydrolysing)
VLLNGQFGNFTISFGDITSYLSTLYKKGKLVSVLKEVKYYCKFYNLNYNQVLKYFTRLALPEGIKNAYHILKGTNIPKSKKESLASVNPEFALRLNADKRLKKAGVGPYQEDAKDITEIRKLINSPIIYSQAATAETKLSLQYGIAKRDPTRDKRVIEFCMSLPINQFVYQGQERSLIRRSMVDILPDKIRLNYSTRGRQSADFAQRLSPYWNHIETYLNNMTQNDVLKQYMNVSIPISILQRIRDYPKDENYQYVQMLLINIVFGHFINKTLKK